MDFDAALAELRAEYAVRLQRDLDDVSEMVLAFAADTGNAEHRERARFQAHRLKGSAGTFGFPAVSEHAGRIEELLRRAAANPDDATLPTLLREALSALTAARPAAP